MKQTILSLGLLCSALLLGFASIVASSHPRTDLPPIGPFPNGYAWGCLPGNVSADLPFCNADIPVAERVSDLVGRLTLVEKMTFLGGSSNTGVDFCTNMDNGVERLGISPYLNLVETNTAVASHCLATDMCATEFPGPTNLAASFNRTLWRAKGNVISTEMRAMNNVNWYRMPAAPFSKIGLSGFGPNINIVRDPRFGRNSELPSEDPFLSGSYAAEYVDGCQHGEDPYYLKMLSGLKHYDAYSVEDNRAGRMFNISTFDLFDTYLAQYRLAFHPDMGDAKAVMCAYSGVNQVPMCANDFLLNQVIRGIWGRSDVVIVTDCGAIDNMVNANKYAANISDAAAKTLNGGSDIDFGDNYFPPVSSGGNGALQEALDEGLTNEARIDESVFRILTNRFLTGLFDPLEGQIYTKIGADAVNSTAAQQLILEGALQGMVLLKNDNKTLPFSIKEGATVAVIGPHVFSQRDLFEDYKGDESCFDGSYDCVQTIATVFTNMAAERGASVIVEKGVDLESDNTTGIPAALDAVEKSNYVVLCIGIGNDQEHEGQDRTDINLPGQQQYFATQVIQLASSRNIPLVMVLINGGIVTIDKLVPATPSIIEAFYPAKRGPEALFLHIFGEANAWGRLPVTIYNDKFTSEISMYDFNMTANPGRTYRYYTETPTFPFGYGLSYTQFDLDCSMSTQLSILCVIQNTGDRSGDEVLMMFHSYQPSQPLGHPVPASSLRDFTRLTLDAGASTSVTFEIDSDDFVLTDANGNRVVYPGSHQLWISDGVKTSQVFTFDKSYSMIEFYGIDAQVPF